MGSLTKSWVASALFRHSLIFEQFTHTQVLLDATPCFWYYVN